jgi:hypothetical protein
MIMSLSLLFLLRLPLNANRMDVHYDRRGVVFKMDMTVDFERNSGRSFPVSRDISHDGFHAETALLLGDSGTAGQHVWIGECIVLVEIEMGQARPQLILTISPTCYVELDH